MLHDEDKPLTPQQAREKIQRGLMDYLAGNDTGPIVFRLKRTKKASETYPLKLTQRQRETLLEQTQLSRNLKKKIKEAGEGTQIVAVTWNELHKLNDATGEAAVYASHAERERLMSVQGKVGKFFAEEDAEIFGFDAPKARKRRQPNSDLLYQFKITLLGVKPQIWRRIQVKDCTLDKLHEHVQTAMGWSNSHLHSFQFGDRRYADPMLMEEDMDEIGYLDSTATMLSDILPKSGERLRFMYEYDFGDSWEHEVLFEGNPTLEAGREHPVCLEGERACPPEDVGGVGGYADFLESIRDKHNEGREESLEWASGWFDPEEFDPTTATKSMKKGLPDWRSMER